MRNLKTSLRSRIPPQILSRIDEVRPLIRNSFGGPMNGQLGRREIVRDIARAFDIDRVAETGTFRGSTTEFLLAVFGVPVHTVEAAPRFSEYARRRLAVEQQIICERGDSRTFLNRLGQQHPDAKMFIYLDAHWDLDLPLREELIVIGEHWTYAVVMIDDFAVPHDEGYRYDNYGNGRALVEDYLPVEALSGWRLFYPELSSSSETGARRGCAVLTSPGASPRRTLATLRHAKTL